MSALSVRADDHALLAGSVEEVIASLPLSLTRAARGTGADVVAIDGGPDWPARAVSAIGWGARALVVVRPGQADTTDLALVVQERPVVVVLDAPWAGGPAVPAARSLFQDAARSRGSLEVRLVVPTTDDLQLALLDGLQLTRAVLGGASDVQPLTWTGHGLQVECRVDQTAVGLAVIRSDATPPQAEVRLLSGSRAVDLQLHDWRSARPAQLTTTTAEGERLVPTLFESAHRATWRRLLHHLRTGAACEDLAGWRADASAAASAAASR